MPDPFFFTSNASAISSTSSGSTPWAAGGGACFSDRAAGEHGVHPARRKSVAAMKCAEERAGDRGIGVGVAAAADGCDERLLERLVAREPVERILERGDDPAFGEVRRQRVAPDRFARGARAVRDAACTYSRGCAGDAYRDRRAECGAGLEAGGFGWVSAESDRARGAAAGSPRPDADRRHAHMSRRLALGGVHPRPRSVVSRRPGALCSIRGRPRALGALAARSPGGWREREASSLRRRLPRCVVWPAVARSRTPSGKRDGFRTVLNRRASKLSRTWRAGAGAFSSNGDLCAKAEATASRAAILLELAHANWRAARGSGAPGISRSPAREIAASKRSALRISTSRLRARAQCGASRTVSCAPSLRRSPAAMRAMRYAMLAWRHSATAPPNDR